MSQVTGNINLLANLLGFNKFKQAATDVASLGNSLSSLGAQFTDINKKIEENVKQVASVGDIFKSVTALTVGELGLKRLKDTLDGLKNTFEETQTASFLLKQALTNVNAEQNFDKVTKFAAEFTENVAVTLPEAYNALARIIEASGNAEEDFLRRSLSAVKNLAVFYNNDLNRAITNFSRVFTNALGQLGKDFPGLRQLREILGDTLFRSGAAADFINQKLGGLAETFAQSNQGLRQLADIRLQRNVLGLGEVISNAVTPAFVEFKNIISNIAQQVKPETLTFIDNVLKSIVGTFVDILKFFEKFNKEIFIAAAGLALFFKPSVGIGAFNSLKKVFDFSFTTQVTQTKLMVAELKNLSTALVAVNTLATAPDFFLNSRNRFINPSTGSFISPANVVAANALKSEVVKDFKVINDQFLATTVAMQNLGIRGFLPLRGQNKVFKELAQSATTEFQVLRKALTDAQKVLVDVNTAFASTPIGGGLKALANVGVAGLLFRKGQTLTKTEAGIVQAEIGKIEDKVTSLNSKLASTEAELKNLQAASAATTTSLLTAFKTTLGPIALFATKIFAVVGSIVALRTAFNLIREGGEDIDNIFGTKITPAIQKAADALDKFIDNLPKSGKELTAGGQALGIIVVDFFSRLAINASDLSQKTQKEINDIKSAFDGGIISFKEAQDRINKLKEADINARLKAFDDLHDQNLTNAVETQEELEKERIKLENNFFITRQSFQLESKRLELIKQFATSELLNIKLSRDQLELNRQFINGEIGLTALTEKRLELVAKANEEEIVRQERLVETAQIAFEKAKAAVPASRDVESDELALARLDTLREETAKLQALKLRILLTDKEILDVETRSGDVLKKLAVDLDIATNNLKENLVNNTFGDIDRIIGKAKRELEELALSGNKIQAGVILDQIQGFLNKRKELELQIFDSTQSIQNAKIEASIARNAGLLEDQLLTIDRRFKSGEIDATTRDKQKLAVNITALTLEEVKAKKELDDIDAKLDIFAKSGVKDQTQKNSLTAEAIAKQSALVVIQDKIRTLTRNSTDEYVKQQAILDTVNLSFAKNKDDITKIDQLIQETSKGLADVKLLNPQNIDLIDQLQERFNSLLDTKVQLTELDRKLAATRVANLLSFEIEKARSQRLLQDLTRDFNSGKVSAQEFLIQENKIKNLDLTSQEFELNEQIRDIGDQIVANKAKGNSGVKANLVLQDQLNTATNRLLATQELIKENAKQTNDIYILTVATLSQVASKLEPILIKLGSFPGGLLQQVLGNPNDAKLIKDGVKEIDAAVIELKNRFAGNFDDPEFVKALGLLESKLLELKNNDIGFKVGRAIREGLEVGIGDALEKIIVQGEKVGDTFRALAQDIIITAAKLLTNEAVKQFFRIALSLFAGGGTSDGGLFAAQGAGFGQFADGGIVPGSYKGYDDKIAAVHSGEGFIPEPRLRDEGSRSVFELLRTGFGPMIAAQLNNIPKVKPFSPKFSFAQGGIVGPGSGSPSQGGIVRALIGDDEIKRFVRTPTFFSELQKIHQEKGRQLLGQ